MRFHIVTILPELFSSFLQGSLIGKAVREGTLSVDLVDPRDFTSDKHRSVDDTPFGGGQGMLLKAEPVVAAMESIERASRIADGKQRIHRVLLTPDGDPLTQRHMDTLRQHEEIVLVCGRYEGFDERVRAYVDQELSLGDFVLAGGEVAAMAIVEGVGRLVPGVLGNDASSTDDSHIGGLLEYPQYTRPREFRGESVPEVLLGGDHQRVAEWRRAQQLQRTRERRPDLWRAHPCAAEEQRRFADQSYIALLHHPVCGPAGEIVTTALTNLDVHDLARASRTYDLAGYFIVTPIQEQQQLAARILQHWAGRDASQKNSDRAEALRLVRQAATLAAVIDEITSETGQAPTVVATTARTSDDAVSCAGLRDLAQASRGPVLILFGTGFGLAKEVLERADAVLAPVVGPSPYNHLSAYNHLSVRAAAAIILDRLFGMREEPPPRLTADVANTETLK